MIWILVLGLGLVALAPFLVEAARPPMDTTLQAEAPGQFAMLPGDGTHYRWDGPEGGPVLVLIHGLSSPNYVFDPVIAGLNQLGFRTLRYDLWGRGYSDRAPGDQDEAYFVAQLTDLLDALKVTGRVSLMGYSMGGMIATAFAAKDANRVEHLALIAPAGMAHSVDRMTRVMRDTPMLGDWACRWLGVRAIRKGIAAGSGDAEIKSALTHETRLRGCLPAVLSSLRHTLIETQEAEHARIGRAAIPVMALWGADDEVIPPQARQLLGAWNPEVQQHVIDGADHAVLYTHPDAVVAGFAQLSDDFI